MTKIHPAAACLALCLALAPSCKDGRPKPAAGSASAKPAAGALARIGYKELEALAEGRGKTPYLLLDVRRPDEFAEGRIPTAVNLPYDEIAEGKPDPPKDELVIVYCRSGRRSAIAAGSLAALGFTNVADFGGIDQWKGSLERQAR